MIKVVIIDDDYLVRINLKMMIDWEAYGLTVVGEAENGLEGLTLIEELKPDFAIIDIKMPSMSGLELSEKIREREIELYYIMLSNYDEYEYVRGAMKNGAKDFLLKHKLNPESLTEQIAMVVEALAVKKHVDVIDEGRLLEKQAEELIMNILVGELTKREDIEDYLADSGIHMGMYNVIPMIMIIDHYQINIQNKGMDYVYKLRKNICFLLKEILQKQEKALFIQIEDNKYVLMISYEDYRSEMVINQMKNRLLHHIRGQIEAYYNESVTFSIGDMVPIQNVKESYARAYNHLGMKFYLGDGMIIDEQAAVPLMQVEPDVILTSEAGKRLMDVHAYDDQEIDKLLTDIFHQIRQYRMNKASAMDVVSHLLEGLEKALECNHISMQRLYEDVGSKTMLQFFETADTYRTWLSSLIKLAKGLLKEAGNDYSDPIHRAIHYVKNHYGENISLSLVAEHIGINSSYLSKLFKDEVGLGFNQFLCQERIQRVKELIQSGQRDFRDIADSCGFNNYAYFFKVFKKHVGKTPKQYISTLRS